ncbi:MAG: hypothetical protein MK110_12085 [Fuerstiella sp.]|nr:hypothetical protein [Fuerstiella sp.]
MKSFPAFTLIVFGTLFLSGCSDNGIGGGASQATSIVVLPPDLFGAAEEDSGNDLSESPGTTTSAGDGTGNLSGQVVMTGDVPAVGLIHAQGAAVKDAVACSAEDMPNEKLVLGGGNGVANTFVYIKKAPKGTPRPTPVEEAVIFDQKNCRFLPHCLVVPTGQLVKVLSDDTVSHNTHSYPSRNAAVNQTVDPGDRVGKLEFVYKSAEKEPVRVVCDFHTWMSAWHLPVEHPYAALTDADGNFEINDLPSGDHVFQVWHEAAKGKFVNRKLKVQIRPGETTSVKIDYPSSQLEL